MFFDNQCFTNKMVLLCKFQKEGYVSIQKKVLRKKTITFYEDKFLLLGFYNGTFLNIFLKTYTSIKST